MSQWQIQQIPDRVWHMCLVRHAFKITPAQSMNKARLTFKCDALKHYQMPLSTRESGYMTLLTHNIDQRDLRRRSKRRTCPEFPYASIWDVTWPIKMAANRVNSGWSLWIFVLFSCIGYRDCHIRHTKVSSNIQSLLLDSFCCVSYQLRPLFTQVSPSVLTSVPAR